ncbi:hypothetical protein AE1304_41500 [Aeromonas enteropelogenes]
MAWARFPPSEFAFVKADNSAKTALMFRPFIVKGAKCTCRSTLHLKNAARAEIALSWDND